jgi:predicted nucleotidyltransferase
MIVEIFVSLALNFKKMRKVQTKLFYEITSKVKQMVKEFDPNAEVILFGSRARGDYKKDSDWDFLILTDKAAEDKTINDLKYNIFKIVVETKNHIFPMVENKSDWKNIEVTEIFQNIKNEGLAL